MTRRAAGLAAFGAAAAGGAALGWMAERRALRNTMPRADPEWDELRRAIRGQPFSVESFDGTMLHAEVLGPDDAPTIVFAHGYGLSQHSWHYQRRDLADEFRLVLYDQRGHAGSEEAAGGEYSAAALGRDLAAVVDAMVPAQRPVVLVGHSMGGMTILSYVDQFPEASERIAGAVFIDTSGSDVVAGGVVSTGYAALRTVADDAVRRAFRTLGWGARYADRAYAASSDLSYLLTREIGLNRDASPAQVAFVEQMLLDCPNTVKAAIGPMFTSLDLRGAARLLKAPALVLVGAQDRLTPPAQAQRLVELLGDARLVTLEGVGHTSMLEAADTVTAHVRAHARRVLS